jgi:hypothetical protein
MSEQEKTAFYSKIQEIITAYQDFAVDYASVDKNVLSELLNFRLQTKALLLNSSTAMRSRILNSGDAVLIEKFTNWLHTKEQLALIFSLPAGKEQRVKVRQTPSSKRPTQPKKNSRQDLNSLLPPTKKHRSHGAKFRPC